MIKFVSSLNNCVCSLILLKQKRFKTRPSVDSYLCLSVPAFRVFHHTTIPAIISTQVNYYSDGLLCTVRFIWKLLSRISTNANADADATTSDIATHAYANNRKSRWLGAFRFVGDNRLQQPTASSYDSTTTTTATATRATAIAMLSGARGVRTTAATRMLSSRPVGRERSGPATTGRPNRAKLSRLQATHATTSGHYRAGVLSGPSGDHYASLANATTRHHRAHYGHQAAKRCG